jgi:hypothetical protein
MDSVMNFIKREDLMKQLKLMLVTFFAVLLCNSMVFANGAPAAPVLTVSITGTQVDLNLTAVAGADGYKLFYAPENLSVIYNMDLGTQTSLSISLWDGASFYVAVKAYNGAGTSDFSNIELVKMSSGKYQLETVQTFPQGLNVGLISGDGAQCHDYSSMDMTVIMEMNACMMGCGSDIACITACSSSFVSTSESFAYLTMALVNSTPGELTITLPGGTAFVPASSGTQTMIIGKDVVITIPAMGTITECLPVFCIDPDLDAPGDGDVFQLSGIASKACLQEILAKVKGKTISDAWKLQDMIWNCVDPSLSVSQEEWDWLESIP